MRLPKNVKITASNLISIDRLYEKPKVLKAQVVEVVSNSYHKWRYHCVADLLFYWFRFICLNDQQI